MEHSVSASNHCNSHVHRYGKKAYILKYQLDFKNNLINIGCATLYHLSMTYITVYNKTFCLRMVICASITSADHHPQTKSFFF